MHAPMRGWTTSPEIGPARKTIDIADLDSPSDMRYGVPDDQIVVSFAYAQAI